MARYRRQLPARTQPVLRCSSPSKLFADAATRSWPNKGRIRAFTWRNDDAHSSGIVSIDAAVATTSAVRHNRAARTKPLNEQVEERRAWRPHRDRENSRARASGPPGDETENKMTDIDVWTSPAEAMDMLFDVREEGVEGLDLALLRPRSRGMANTLRTLLLAKLQPVRPDAASWTTRCGVPVTARDYRLVLAEGAPDPASISRLVNDYDTAVRPQQRLLAAVLTVRATTDAPVHDLMTTAIAFATHRLSRDRGLTSVVVLHTPCDELADAAVHAHVVVFARVHGQAGFSVVHEDLNDKAQGVWAKEWRSFLQLWNKLPEE